MCLEFRCLTFRSKMEYNMRGSTVIAQVLYLTPEEKQKIWDALLVNMQTDNQVYRYNFFFENCATRPATIIEQNLNGTLQIGTPDSALTFRDMINECTKNHPWQTFGCDLALGSPTDRLVTPNEAQFLPLYLLNSYRNATITNPDGSKRILTSAALPLTSLVPAKE